MMPATKPARLPNASDENGDASSRKGFPVAPAGPPGPTSNGTAPRRTPNALVQAWRVVKSVYYASAPSWQVLKSGALLFFGFFCWSSANLLLSYQPGWTVLYYVMAYGFLLTWYGPLTHLALVPRVIPWLRRHPRGGALHRTGKNLTMISLTLFFTAVLALGALRPGVMTIDFHAMTTASSTADVNPTLACTHDATGASATISCRLEDTAGIGMITVESGGRELLTRRSGDFAFSLHEDDLVEIVGRREFQVIVRTSAGDAARRFTRSVATIR